jgi:LacI family transcriptional regulator
LLQTLHGRVDGLVLMTPGLGGVWLQQALPRRVPVMLLNGEDGRHDSLRIDNRQGAGLAVAHLVALGHRRIAFVGGPAGNTDAGERNRGYREAMAAASLVADTALELAGDFGEESGARAGEVLAGLARQPTAIFAANDEMAIGCLGALRERGLAVPGDFSLVGFDDIPIARYVTPALTTVHVPIAELGTRAMERLLERVEGKGADERRHDTVATSLVLRESTAPPRRTDREQRARGPKGETS